MMHYTRALKRLGLRTRHILHLGIDQLKDLLRRTRMITNQLNCLGDMQKVHPSKCGRANNRALKPFWC